MPDPTRDELLRRLDELWRITPQPLSSGLPLVGQLKEQANALTRWYVQPIVAQQNQFNAAVVQAMHSLAASIDQRSDALAQQHQLQSEAEMRRFERNELLIQQDRETLQQIHTQLANNLAEHQKLILATQEFADYLRQRIEADEQRIERNRELLEYIVQHIHDLDEMGTALTAQLSTLQLAATALPPAAPETSA
jgi:DNA repair exonuclease SbcCD ATPase subunit